MSRKLITVANQTLQNSPFFQRLMCGSNGKCLITFDEKNQKAHSGGLLMGDKNAVGTEPFMILIGGVQWSGLSQALLRISATTMKTLSSMSSQVAATMELSCSCLSELLSDSRRLCRCNKHHLSCEVM